MSINGPTAFDAMVDEIVREVCEDLHSKISTAITGIRFQDEYGMTSSEFRDRVIQEDRANKERLLSSLEKTVAELVTATERVEELESLIEKAQHQLSGIEDNLRHHGNDVEFAQKTLDKA